MAGRIFINYRRDDTAGYAHFVYEHLSKEFGPKNVFIDVFKINPGENFVEAINRAVSLCDVLIVLIGPRWLHIQDENGAKRLEDPNDFVRLEITAALDQEKKVIPVLFDRADMPSVGELPGKLKPLATRQAVRIGERVKDDIQRVLIISIKQAVQESRRAKTKGRTGDKSFSSMVAKFLRSHAALFSLILGTFLVLAIALAVMIGRGMFGGPGSPDPTEAATAGAPGTTPLASVIAPGGAVVLQWRLDGDRAVIQQEQKYWEKYAADTNPAGLYLRSDNIDAFGDFLELNSDRTFTLEESGTARTGSWELDGDTLTLTFP